MLTLFFVDDLPTAIGTQYEFSNEDSHHAIKVLRLAAGEIFNLSDGEGAWSRVVIENVNKKSMTVKVLETGLEEVLSTQFTIIQAIPKGDRIKESIELSTEGGVDRIIMWKSERSIGRIEDKLEKLQHTAREASKQSRRFRIPEVESAATRDHVIDEIANADLALIFHESATMRLSQVVTPGPKKVLAIIGPEGGLTDDEVEAFAAAGAKIVLMGRPILRSAHAGLAALAAINTALSVW